MGLGVFILPNGELKSKITFWKKKIEEELHEQPYTNHPPHLTIIHSNINEYKAAINEIKECLERLKSFKLTVSKNNIFWDDLFTGGNTLSYNIKKNEYLNDIQKQLSTVFSKYKDSNEIPKFFRANRQLYDSYLDFGFPFVGDHWIPHFTISSLKVAKNHKIIKDFLLDQIDISFTVNKISVWDINGNQHQMIEEFTLQ
tara:strand:+ start:557 stop:1153 length:597 start_codon:yes stop_codon:yes gene_type:complete